MAVTTNCIPACSPNTAGNIPGVLPDRFVSDDPIYSGSGPASSNSVLKGIYAVLAGGSTDPTLNDGLMDFSFDSGETTGLLALIAEDF